MQIAELFKHLHGSIDMSNIENIIAPDVVKYLDIDRSCLFRDKNNAFYPYFYWDEFNYIPFNSLDIDVLRFMKAKEMIHQRKEMMKNMSYSELFNIADKKILIPMFIKKYRDIEENEVYDIFISIYTRSEYGFAGFSAEILEYVFSKRFLSEKWKSRIKKIKKPALIIYRGEGKLSTNNISWTLSKKTARFFADRFQDNGRVLTMQISKDDVIDYLTDRAEEEILCIK